MSKFAELPEGTPLTWPKDDDRDYCTSEYDPGDGLGGWPWLCTGPKGHEGPHVAEGVNSSHASWEG